MIPTTNSSHVAEKISPATTSETMPIAMVSNIPIGSLPGWMSRPSAPTMAPTMMSQTQCMATVYRASRSAKRDSRLGERLELAAELLDLVAQPRCVLEAQLLGGDEHLLLERDRELLELLAGHALDVGSLPAAALARDVRLVELEELGDVGYALLDLDG